MNRADRGEIRRVWGRTEAAKQLIIQDMTCTDLIALQDRYKELGLHGPYWHGGRHGRQMWNIQCYASGKEDGVLHTTTYWAGCIDLLIDPEEICAEFVQRGAWPRAEQCPLKG